MVPLTIQTDPTATLGNYAFVVSASTSLGVEGTVQAFLSIVIDRQGKVIEAAPVSFDEWAPNLALTKDPRLREAAMEAVKQWKYNLFFSTVSPSR